MGETPEFFFALPDVTDGALTTLVILYKHVPGEVMRAYFAGEGPAPFTYCSAARILKIYGGRRKRATVYKDIAQLAARGIIVPAERVVRGELREGYLLPLRELPNRTPTECQEKKSGGPARESMGMDSPLFHGQGLVDGRVSAHRPPGPRGETFLSTSVAQNSPINEELNQKAELKAAAAAVDSSQDRRDLTPAGRDLSAYALLKEIASIWLPLNEQGEPEAKRQIYPASRDGQQRIERLLEKLTQSDGGSRERAWNHVLRTCRDFAEICKANPKKRKWWSMGMFSCDPREAHKPSWWQTVEGDVAAGHASAREAEARQAREEAQAAARQAQVERERLEWILLAVENPRPPSEFELQGWDMLPYWHRMLLLAPGAAKAAVHGEVARARQEQREVELRDICMALNNIVVDPDPQPEEDDE